MRRTTECGRSGGRPSLTPLAFLISSASSHGDLEEFSVDEPRSYLDPARSPDVVQTGRWERFPRRLLPPGRDLLLDEHLP
jgi:hypothetical protein